MMLLIMICYSCGHGRYDESCKIGSVILFKSWALIQRCLGFWKSPSMRAPTVAGVSRGAALQAVGFRP